MSIREIVLRADERWCKAVEKHLLDGSVQDALDEHLDELINRLPENVYEKISRDIWREKEQNRRFAVLDVTEQGMQSCFIAEEQLDMLTAACRLRGYMLRLSGGAPPRFAGMFRNGRRIPDTEFNKYAAERMENTGRVVGAFRIDLDRGTFDALHIMDGWQRFRVRDVTSAASFALKADGAAWDERWRVFVEHLDGKQLGQEMETAELNGNRLQEELQPGEMTLG